MSIFTTPGWSWKSSFIFFPVINGGARGMKVHLWLQGYLTQFTPDKAVKEQSIQDISEGTTIGSLLAGLTIPEWRVDEIYLNGVRVKTDEVLSDGDNLHIYPQIFAGG
jgi:hypothetical protein